MRNVIVSDLKYRMALAPVRTLFKAGYPVTGIEFESTPPHKAIGFYSSCLADKRFLPDEDSAFIDALIKLCREKTEGGEKPVIVPVGRRVLNVLLDVPEISRYADFIVPVQDSMELADDKGALYELATSLGIPAPKTCARSEYTSIEELAGSVKYPSFIKFRNGELLGLKPVERYKIVRNAGELVAEYPKMDARDPDPIVQEFAPGRDVGIAAVTDKSGDLVDFLCYESLREFPASGGPTCLCRTLESPKMVKYAEKLLRALKYQGIAMLDFRGSAENPLLLELNPRVWGSANLCDVADSSLFVSYVRAASGEKSLLSPERTPLYKTGITMRFSPQNAASFISYIKNGRPFFKTAGDYIKTTFDGTVQEGFNRPGDRAPYRRYIKNLILRR